ncbi:ankyrin [Thozetella sp. PMI_491]|nr:ankyrin [Thozetella sp. PMI_491]
MAMPSIHDLPAPPKELASYIASHPDIPMVEIMKPYRQYEAQLRTVFAQDRANPALNDPHLNVLPLFTNDTKFITTRARDLASEPQEEQDRYIMALPAEKRRAHGSPAVVQSIKEFQKNFNIFSESSLADLNWDNVVAAGSSVVNCLLPVPPEFSATKRKLREYYHEKLCPASDVDLFLYGLTHEEAVEKIKEIEQSIRDAILSEVTVVRTKYAITIASQYPTRHVQIVLRVYKSVGEILTGFDIDAAGGAYDGKQVYVAPRALGSFITQINHIDLTRRSPSYENRLSKYSRRNFEVYWPELDRSRVDPTIFERSFQRTLGLARLLVLERLPTSSARETYMNKRRQERGRPEINRTYFRHLGGNIKDLHEDEVADWVDESEVSNYHTFTVPYGPKFHAKKIEKLCYTKDLLLNAEWNQHKDREVYLHRHPAFFGRVRDVIEDCCGTCPKPVTPEEIEVAEKEAEIYISGKVSFLIDNPGRQQIGSFNPLTEDDWTDMAYIGNTARLCQSIVDKDNDDVLSCVSQEGFNPNKRDYTGRAPLHLAVGSSTPEIVRTLVDHGARITARLADGRTALHLAAERGNPEIVKILMEKSAENEAEAEQRQANLRMNKFGRGLDGTKSAEKGREEDEEDDDDDSTSDGELLDEADADRTSIATGSFVKIKKEEEDQQDVALEEPADEPDFYKVDILSWDIPCSPLHLAISGGYEQVVSVLCEYGSDVILPVKFLNDEREPTNAILTLALALTLPLEKAKSMANLLLRLGASSSQADLHGCTAFHRYVNSNESEMVDTLWEFDKTGVKAALNHLLIESRYWDPPAISPLHTAIGNGDTILVMKLLEAGANPQIDFEHWLKAAKFSTRLEGRLRSFEENQKTYRKSVQQPLITALTSCPDPEVAYLLLRGGADPNTMTQVSYQLLDDEWQRRYNQGETALDLVRNQLEQLRKYTGEKLSAQNPELPEGIREYLDLVQAGTYQHWVTEEDIKQKLKSHERAVESYKEAVKNFEGLTGVAEKQQAIREAISQVEKVEQLLVEMGGKTFQELHPDIKTNTDRYHQSTTQAEKKKECYQFNITFRNATDVTDIRRAAYLELFEAAWVGNLDKIKALTTQSWGDDHSEPPLNITVQDMNGNHPMSLAFLRGHVEVARAVLEIAMAQYAPEEKERVHFRMQTSTNDGGGSEDEDEYSDGDSDDSDGEPRIVSKAVDQKFTIDNIGQVSMQVKSRTRPSQLLEWAVPTFRVENGKITEVSQLNLIQFVLSNDDHAGLKALLDMAIHFASQKLDGDDDLASGLFSFPEHVFLWAIENGKTQMLAEIIRRTGAGLPLDHLVKKSGVEVKEKPRYYQGLTVYGRKRKDWANAGRELVVKSTGTKTPLLLQATLNTSVESVEWLLSDSPLRNYLEFGNSKAAQNDSRLKHLSQGSGGFERVVGKWLGAESELVIHCAAMNRPTQAACQLLKYLVQACPATLETKNSDGETPLMIACRFGRIDFVKILLEAGADQSVRNRDGYNLLHAALAGCPTAEQLRPLLELLDTDLLEHLCLSRSNLYEKGTTPLHTFIDTVTRSSRYDNDGQWLSVLELLLNLSKGSELEMLNGAGDTCLHTAIMQRSTQMVRALLDFKPKLLYRENAVGRTPAEVARDRVTAQKFQAPRNITLPSNNSVVGLLGKSTQDFAASKAADKPPTETQEMAVWRICREFMAKHPDRRRLVSLNEANDIAKRLGEKFYSSRYFSVQPKYEEEEEESNDEKPPSSDFSARQVSAKWREQWICPDCFTRH